MNTDLRKDLNLASTLAEMDDSTRAQWQEILDLIDVLP